MSRQTNDTDDAKLSEDSGESGSNGEVKVGSGKVLVSSRNCLPEAEGAFVWQHIQTAVRTISREAERSVGS